MKIRILLSSLLILSGGFLAKEALAEGASLYLSPNSGTFLVGSTFNVSLFLNTGGKDINAVRADIKFDPRKIQIASPTAGKSFISVWVAQPTYSNIEGTASFQGGIPSPGINTSSGLVSTITFRVVTPGETAISLLESSRVFLDDGKGTNILTSLDRGSYSLEVPPPQGPKVFSPSHPDQNKWYNNSNPTFTWEKEEGVSDFSYSIDREYYGLPDNISEGSQGTVSFSEIKDGTWYFHIKAKKAGNWGGVSSYPLQIDTTPPASFEVEISPSRKGGIVTSEKPTVSFVTTDNLSGTAYYTLKLVNLAKAAAGKETGFFIDANSPYQLPVLEAAEYEIVVRAFDFAMNWQDSSKRFEIVPGDRLFALTKRGIVVFTVFIPWSWLILIMLFFLALIVFFIFWRRRTVKRLSHLKTALGEARKKLEKNNEDIQDKLYDR